MRVTFGKLRRLCDQSIDLEDRIVALVGPNEAGKSTLLEGLALLDHSGALAHGWIARGERVDPTDTLVEAKYALSEEERGLAAEYGFEPEVRWYVRRRRVDGGMDHFVQPDLRIDPRRRLPAVTEIKKIADAFRQQLAIEGDSGERESLMNAVDRLCVVGEGTDGIVDLAEIDSILKTAIRQPDAAELSKALQALKARAGTPANADDFLERIAHVRPRFVAFTEEHRSLAAEYSMSVLANPPEALRNLLAAAGLEVEDLAHAVRNADHGARSYLEDQANQQLRRRFADAWSQSGVSVHLVFDSDTLRVMATTARGYVPIAERSQGLRTFVALLAFSACSSKPSPMILLIDEAESHLHYAAQADLIAVLQQQRVAQQVIYSTHSAGC